MGQGQRALLYRYRVCGNMDLPFHVEVGVPVPGRAGSPITGDGRVVAGSIPAGRYEFYLSDPAVEPDPEKWSIKLAYLLR